MQNILAVLFAVATVASAAQQTLYLSDSDKSVKWTFGNGQQSTLTLSCGVHGFDLILDSPASTTSTVLFTSPSGTCSSNLVCQGSEPTGPNGSVVDPGDYEDQVFEFRKAVSGSAKCVTGKVEASYESCMSRPMKKDAGIEYEAEVLIKQSHAITTIAPCQLDHQTIIKLKCCVTPPEIPFNLTPNETLHELKACEQAEFDVVAADVQTGEQDHISFSVFSKNIEWVKHDHVGYFVHSCTGTAGGQTIDLFHHETSNVVAGKTQDCDKPDLSVAFGQPELSRPNYFYVFDMPYVLPAGVDANVHGTLDIYCKVRFCNKGSEKLFAADCPVYPTSIVDAVNAPGPDCSKSYAGKKGSIGVAKVTVDHSS